MPLLLYGIPQNEYATMADMEQGQSPAYSIPPINASPGNASAMPFSAWIFRLVIGILGLALTVAVATQLPVAAPVDLVMLALVMLAAETFLSIRINQQRAISLGATFTFIAFLGFGAATAVVLQVSTWLVSHLVRHLIPSARSSNLIYVLFNAGQLALCGLAGGLGVQLILGTSLWEPPEIILQPLMFFVSIYLLLNIVLTTVAIWLRYGLTEVRENLWPNVTLWTIAGVGLSAPVAMFVTALDTNANFVADILVAFSFLVIVSYIVRINLRYQSANRELRALNEISRNLAGSLELDNLYPAIYANVRQVMPVDVFFIGLVNEDRSEIEIVFLVEGDELLAPRRLPLEGSVTERVLRDPKPVIISDPESLVTRTRFGRPDRKSAAVMLVPLCLGNQLIGVMSAQSYAPDVYTEQQLYLLDSIGRIAAVAINNARLFAREKEVLRGREEFVSLVAHELRNPLAALIGHTQLLERRVRTADDKLRRPVAVIQEQSERLNRLVEDLLDLSRADTGRLTLHLQRLDIGSLVRNVVDQQRVLTTKHRLTVKHPDTLPLLEGDVMRLTQVLQNLLSNAIKYSPDGGEVTIELSVRKADDPRWPCRTRRTVESNPLWLVVTVTDHGIGIPPEQIHRIFERFYRATNIAGLEISGTGLGLSVVESIVRAHGGVVWAESEWGEGSTFACALPVPPAEIAAYEQQQTPPPSIAA